MDDHFPVQMRPHRTPGIPDQADKVAALHFLSGSDQELGLVRIRRINTPAMVNDSVISVDREQVGKKDRTVRGCINVYIIRSIYAEIDAGMIIGKDPVIICPAVSESGLCEEGTDGILDRQDSEGSQAV